MSYVPQETPDESATDEARLLVELERTLEGQLTDVAAGRIDQAAHSVQAVESLLASLRAVGISRGGRTALERIRRSHEQVALALRQQQAEIKAELARVSSGRKILRAYGRPGPAETL